MGVTNIPANVNRNRLLWPLSKSSAISPLLRKQQTSIKSARGLTSFHWDRASWADNTSLAFVLSSVIPRCMQQLFLCLLWNRAFFIKGEKRLWKIAGIFISFRFAKKKRLWNIPVPFVSDIPKKKMKERLVSQLYGAYCLWFYFVLFGVKATSFPGSELDFQTRLDRSRSIQSIRDSILRRLGRPLETMRNTSPKTPNVTLPATETETNTGFVSEIEEIISFSEPVGE